MASANAFAVHRFIRGQLAADTTLAAAIGGTASPRIYESQAPQGAALPYVVFSPITWGEDVAEHAHYRIMQTWLYQVVGHVENDFAQLETIANRIDAALDRTSGTVTGGTVLFCAREREIVPPPTNEAGIVFRQAGGEYRLTVQA